MSRRAGPIVPTAGATSVLLLGSDALLSARPATPVQMAHACARAGYAMVLPASWGDELIAKFVIAKLSERAPGPAIQCSCPVVAHRLLAVGRDLEPALLPTVSPPVALARYVRAIYAPAAPRITYVGACPGAVDGAIDVRILPATFLAMLGERQIAVDTQPSVYESVIPPDRRRFWSQAGGAPRVEALWTEAGGRTLMEVFSEDFPGELAQVLLGGKNVLVDTGPRLGCVCAGAIPGVDARSARTGVAELEPPHATSPLIDATVVIDLDLPLPAASRTPLDVIVRPADGVRPTAAGYGAGSETAPRRRTSGGETRISPTGLPRLVVGAVSSERRSDGKPRSLPRAYVARRRSSPKALHRSELVVEPEGGGQAVAASDDNRPAAHPTSNDVSGTHGTRFQLTPMQLAMVASGGALILLIAIVVGILLGRGLTH